MLQKSLIKSESSYFRKQLLLDLVKMRLINVKLENGMFFEEFNEPDIPKYAILSHVWEKDEVSYAEVSSIFSSLNVSAIIPKAGFEKIKRFAAIARRSRFDYIWIDTCA